MADLLVFFKAAEPKQLADPGPQLSQVLDFRKQLESSKQHLFAVFDELDVFRKRLQKHLASWVYAHEQSRALGPSTAVTQVVEPPPEGESSPELEEAERLAQAGRLTEAETLFSRLIVGEPNPDAINRYGHFLLRVGRLGQAEVMYERLLGLAADFGEKWKAKGYGNLGGIYQARGELERAEEMLRKALEIDEQLGSREGMAINYANLGLIYQTHGELENARNAWRRSIDLFSALGAPHKVQEVESLLADLPSED